MTYDVVGVWDGAFFRLDDHIRRFRASMDALHMKPAESDDEIKAVLHRLVRLSGLRAAYVAMDCLRGVPAPGKPRHPAYARNYIAAFAVPWVSVAGHEMCERGLHLIIAAIRCAFHRNGSTLNQKFPLGRPDARAVRGNGKGADFAILLDAHGNVTEGAGFNVFSITNGVVATPDRGALDGITRLSMIELCAELGIPCEVRPVSAAELREANEIFTCTTAGGVMPASRIDGRIMAIDRPGPVSCGCAMPSGQRAEGWHATPVDYDCDS